jgi:hypothetical protein
MLNAKTWFLTGATPHGPSGNEGVVEGAVVLVLG